MTQIETLYGIIKREYPHRVYCVSYAPSFTLQEEAEGAAANASMKYVHPPCLPVC